MSKTSFKTISYNSSTKVLTINGVDYTLDSAASGESVSCGSFGEVSLTSEGVLTINGTAINLPLDLPDNLILDVNGNVIKASDGYLITTVPYSITCSVTNGTETGDTYILPDGTATITITPSSGYDLPSTITVSGASYSYDSTTGVIGLSNPSDDVSISVVCEAEEENFLTFESDDGSEFTLGTDAGDYGSIYGNVFGSDGTLEYSTDKENWSSWTPTTTLTSVNGKLYLRGSNNTYLSVYSSCFLKGTKITLADGSTKNVEDLTYNDELKVWNFDTGEYDTASICWLTKPKLKNYHYYQLTFSDGTVLKTTGQKSNHKVYNVDERYFKGVNVTEVGDRIFSENGIATVVDKQLIEEEVLYYNLITSLNFCCFANGILTSDRYGNIYPIDENMMFIKNDRPIRPYSEFEAVDISKYWYDNLRLGENTETIEETKKYIGRLESQMKPLEDE